MIEFTVEKDFLPGYFLSVVVMSPRVSEKPVENDQVDLGKPAFRMGYVMTTVIDPYKELKITVTPGEETYKPGDRVTVDLAVEPREDGRASPLNSPSRYWTRQSSISFPAEGTTTILTRGSTPSTAWMWRTSVSSFSLWAVRNSRKRGRLRPGDGGVPAKLRSVFKFVSYWNPSILPDAEGKARIAFDAPDNLTGWRVLALAVTPDDLMGLGEGPFAVNQPDRNPAGDAQPGHRGDSFQAGFSILNRTSESRELTLTVTAGGNVGIRPKGRRASPVGPQVVSAAPYKRNTVWLPVDRNGGRESILLRPAEETRRIRTASSTPSRSESGSSLKPRPPYGSIDFRGM